MVNYRLVSGNNVLLDIADRFGGKSLDESLDENKINSIVVKQGKLIKYLSFIYLAGLIISVICFLLK